MRTESVNGAKFTPVIELDHIDHNMLTAAQASGMADCSIPTVNRASASGHFQAYSRKNYGTHTVATLRRTHYYKLKDIQKWIAAGKPTRKVVPIEEAPPTAPSQDALLMLTATMARMADDIAAIRRDLGVK